MERLMYGVTWRIVDMGWRVSDPNAVNLTDARVFIYRYRR